MSSHLKKERDDILRQLHARGWEITKGSGGHYKVIAPDGRRIIMGDSASDWRANMATRSVLRRMGEDIDNPKHPRKKVHHESSTPARETGVSAPPREAPREEPMKLEKCDQCAYTDAPASLQAHRNKGGPHGFEVLPCPVDGCSVITSNYPSGASHLRRSHKDWVGDRSLCSQCMHMTDSYGEMRTHVATQHPFDRTKIVDKRVHELLAKRKNSRKTAEPKPARPVLNGNVDDFALSIAEQIRTFVESVAGSSERVDYLEGELTQVRRDYKALRRKLERLISD